MSDTNPTQPASKDGQDAATSIVLGVGYLSWPRRERVSDRYGTVGLMQETNDDYFATVPHVALEGTEPGSLGTLKAKVLETGQSGHIGDLFRGLSPKESAVGTTLTLGYGLQFLDSCEGWGLVGLKPLEERDSDWLNPEVLYALHEHKVELYFEPEQRTHAV